MSSIFLLMKQVLLKTIIIVVGKLIRSKVLQGGAGLRGVLRGGDGGKKNFSIMQGRVGWGWGKTKLCEVGMKTPSFGPTPPHCYP